MKTVKREYEQELKRQIEEQKAEAKAAKDKLKADIKQYKEQEKADIKAAKEQEETKIRLEKEAAKAEAKAAKELIKLAKDELKARAEEYKSGIQLVRNILSYLTRLSILKDKEYTINTISNEQYNNGSYSLYTLDYNGIYELGLNKNGQYVYNPNMPVSSESALHKTLEAEHKNFIDRKLQDQKKGVLGTLTTGYRYIQNMFMSIDKGQVAKRSEFRNKLIEGVIDNPEYQADIKFLKDNPKDIYVALYDFLRYGKPITQTFKIKGVERTLNESTIRYLENLKDLIESVPGQFAELGVATGFLPGYVPQSHSIHKILKAGFDKWYEFIDPLVEFKRETIDDFKTELKEKIKGSEELPDILTGVTLDMVEGIPESTLRKAILKEIYDGLVDTYGSYEAGAKSYTSGIKKHRGIHFNDADGHLAYAEKFGEHTKIITSLNNHLLSVTKLMSIFNNFGTKPYDLANSLIKHVTEKNTTYAESLASKAIKYFLNNAMVKTFDRTLAANYDQGWLYTHISTFSSLGKTAALKNNAVWILTEDAINAGVETRKLGRTKENEFRAKYKGEYKKQLDLENALYDFERSLLPDSNVYETPYEFANKINAARDLLGKIQMTDWLSEISKKLTSKRFWLNIGEKINSKTKWSDLTLYFKDILQASGITEADWNHLINIDVIAEEHPYWTNFEIAGETVPVFSISKLISKPNKTAYEARLSHKLLLAEATFMEGALVESSGLTTSMMFGDATAAVPRMLLRGLKDLQGYNAKRIMMLFSRAEWLSKGNPAQQLAGYVTRRMAIGAAHFLLKQAMLGRTLQYDKKEGWIKLMREAAIDGGLLPYVGEILADYIHNQGFTTEEKIVSTLGRMSVGLGASYWLGKVNDIYSLTDAIINKKNDKAINRIKRLFPLTDWVATDLVAQRFIVNPFLAAKYPEAAVYAIKERQRLEQNYMKQFIESNTSNK